MPGPAALLTVASIAHHALHGTPSSEPKQVFGAPTSLTPEGFVASGIPDALMLAIVGLAFLGFASWSRRRTEAQANSER